MTEPIRITPDLIERQLSDTPENRAWIAEWRRVGAPPGSLRYALRTFEEQMAAEADSKLDTGLSDATTD